MLILIFIDITQVTVPCSQAAPSKQNYQGRPELYYLDQFQNEVTNLPDIEKAPPLRFVSGGSLQKLT